MIMGFHSVCLDCFVVCGDFSTINLSLNCVCVIKMIIGKIHIHERIQKVYYDHGHYVFGKKFGLEEIPMVLQLLNDSVRLPIRYQIQCKDSKLEWLENEFFPIH